MLKSLFQNEVRKILSGENEKFTESPADWRDQWIYFLLTDRFNNPHSQPNPDIYPCNVYQGGKFEGIIAKLPYLKKLGAGAIWISPVLFNPQWFRNYWGGYGIQNFLRTDPRFCTDLVAAGQKGDYHIMFVSMVPMEARILANIV
jgi:hypothetical protein